MKIEEYKRYTDGYKEQIDAELKKILGELNYSAEFKEVLEYALFPSGKRLRPILMLEWHNLFAPADYYALRYACGLEILHTYSLIHDDMPCMDNDDYRRGKLTVHKKYGEGTALLAGDALLDLAYRILSMPTPSFEVGPFWMFKELCGDMGLIQGQYCDLYGKIDNLNDLLDMCRHKTGALIKLACISGYALGNNLDYKKCNAIMGAQPGGTKDSADVSSDVSNDGLLLNYVLASGFGEAFGAAFQLYDDISEYIDGEKISSTSVMNYVDLDEAKKMLNTLLGDAADTLEPLSGDTTYLRELLNRFIIV
ncbi:MAG: polyprenyl synthetase family protein [Clostridiales bacterium]|nr:polyprenyl synthetase family protein [Clostridiales bacterium]